MGSSKLESASLSEMLATLHETLDVEAKEWLDLSRNEHRATIAKEIIALANHGGGYLVIGYAEGQSGILEPSTPHPEVLNDWSQDAIQGIVARYIDPLIQCRVSHVSAGGQSKYPVIVVPGGHRVPIRAKAGSPDGAKLMQHRIYIRRPGPTSEEPKSAAEWDALLERCLRNRKDDLLNAMRSIIAGEIPGEKSQSPSAEEALSKFEEEAITRWKACVAPLPKGSPPQFPYGFYDASFRISGEIPPIELSELKRVIAASVRNHSGWPPFLTIEVPPHSPKPVDGAVEFWRGPDEKSLFNDAAHHDFWRVSPDGYLFTRRGYNEDVGFGGLEPGSGFDISTPTWRLGEAILEALYIAEAMGVLNATMLCRARWTGLRGRRLVSVGNPNRYISWPRRSEQDTFEVTKSVQLDALADSLPEVAYSMLRPLYQLFEFFELPKRLVEEELSALRRNVF